MVRLRFYICTKMYVFITVPCDVEVSLACDSVFLRCVVENTTKYASCVPSCYLDNGNCDDDQTCVVALADHGSTVHCLNFDGRYTLFSCVDIIKHILWCSLLIVTILSSFSDLSAECPPGMIMNQCGSLCQESCNDVNGGGIKACPLICGPAACVCPYGLVRYRDRCVDPKECYSLEKCKPQLLWLLQCINTSNVLLHADPPKIFPVPSVVSWLLK